MTNQSQSKPKARPIYRLCYSAKNGVDGNGQAILEYPVEIGGAFARRETEKGLVARFKIIPENMRDGVLFLIPAENDRRDEPDLLGEIADAEAGQ